MTAHGVTGIYLRFTAVFCIVFAVQAVRICSKKISQARNSVGECYLDMVEVGGSNPPVPTSFFEKAMAPLVGKRRHQPFLFMGRL